jgi:phosphoribosylformylglycinamidine synthase
MMNAERRVAHSSFIIHHSSLMKAVVTIELKPSVLDPQGKAIQHSLSSLGFAGVEDVRVGKLFKITLADSEQTRENVESQLRQMCERLLANTVIENFSYTLED